MAQLIKTNYFYPQYGKGKDGFDKIMIVYKEENGEKKFSVVEKPTIEYAITKKDIPVKGEIRSIKNSDADFYKCYYKDIYKNMVFNLGDERVSDYYNLVINDQNKSETYSKLRKLHLDYRYHGTDVNIEDYYINKFLQSHPSMENNFKLTKMFYDIEVDTMNISGFPNPEMAECPVNSISVCIDMGDYIQFYMLTLHYTDNKSYDEFSNNLLENLKDVKHELVSKANKDVKLKIKRFNDELSLIKEFFDIVNSHKPDYLMGWNTHRFDFPYLYNRTSMLIKYEQGLKVEDIMCPKEMPYKSIKYRMDRVHSDPSTNNSSVNVSSYTVHIDQQNLYANLRKGKGNIENYDLDSIAELELGEHKEVITSIKTQHIDDYKKFFLYSAVDTLLLYLLENKNNDIEALYSVAAITQTRIEQCLKKTVCLRNMASKFYEDNGYILSNNRSALKEKIGKPRGAYVAPTHIIENIGMDLNIEGRNELELKIEEELKHIFPDTSLYSDNEKFEMVKSYILDKENLEYLDVEQDHESIMTLLENKTEKDIEDNMLEKLSNIVSNVINLEISEPMSDEAKILSQYLFEEVCDVDLSSLYPSIILALNLSPETFIFKFYIMKKEYDKEAKQEIYVDIADRFVDSYISRDYVSVGNEYLDLPNMDDLIQACKESMIKGE